MVTPTWTMRLATHAHDLDAEGHDTRGGWHKPVRVATTASITIATALNSGDTIDGVTLAAGDRVLVKDQGTGSQNGIYIAGVSPARAEDADEGTEILGGLVYVIAGTSNGGKVFTNTNTSAITVDSTTVSYDQFAAGASIAQLDDVPDVNAPSPGDGDVLTWDSTPGEWVAAAPSAPGGSLPAAKAWVEDDFDARDIPTSPNATYDDEFNDTTGMSGTGNGLNARWNWRNQGSATTAFGTAGWVSLNIPATSSASYRIIEIAALADGTYDALVSIHTQSDTSGDGGGGLVLVDNTNGDFYVFVLVDVSGTTGLYLQRWTNTTTFGSSVASIATLQRTRIHLRVTKSSTTLTFWWSDDGIGFRRLNSLTDAVSADRIGFGCYETKNTGTTKLFADYFRKTA